MRTFHVGGAALARSAKSDIEARYGGVIKYLGLNVVQRRDGTLVAMNRNGEVQITDESSTCLCCQRSAASFATAI
jgi:DNA-directed RNA polymerase subunit beta'